MHDIRNRAARTFAVVVVLALAAGLLIPSRLAAQPAAPTPRTGMFPNTDPPEIRCEVGRRRTLMRAGEGGLSYFPDGPISVLSPRPLHFFMVCGNKTFLFAGEGFEDAVPRIRVVLSPSSRGPDADYAGIYAVWPEPKRERFLCVYHAEDHAGMERSGFNGVHGFYATVCLASYDPQSRRIERRGPIITGDRPKRPVEGPDARILLCQGAGAPHGVVDRDGKYHLCYYAEFGNRKERHVTICLARSPLDAAGAPGSWLKFDRGQFGEPGLGGHDTPVVSCSVGDVSQPQVVYVRPWDRYVLVFACLVFEEYQQGQAERGGFYASTSKDGIRWTEPRQLIRGLTVFKTGHEAVQHPTLVVDKVEDDRLQGRLLYAFTPRWPTPHHLVSNPVTIDRTGR